LQPFRQAGESALPGLTSLTNDQNAQKEFVTENPFFDALADEAQKRLFNNQAARGKVGSGGTAEALQNSLLLLGPQLVQQGIDNRFRLSQLGANAAARQGSATLQTGRDISETTLGQGNAKAAGIIGSGNAIAGGIEGAASSLVQLSDERMKTDIEPVGRLYNGLPVYTFKYKGENKTHMGVMAQEVEKTQPGVVHEFNGIKYVDYGALKCQ
jgi:hypothetical protein